jgi:proteasome lid subunit RPN8/RPN11
VLKISAQLFAAMCDHLVTGYPNEACGILIGELQNHTRVVRQVIPTANVWKNEVDDSHSMRDRFEISPADIVQADRLAEKNGWEIVGYFHSHPDDKAFPSEFDRERAWPEVSYVIASVRDAKIDEVRSFTILNDANVFQEEKIEIKENL